MLVTPHNTSNWLFEVLWGPLTCHSEQLMSGVIPQFLKEPIIFRLATLNQAARAFMRMSYDILHMTYVV